MKTTISVICALTLLLTSCKELKELKGSYEVVEIKGENVTGKGVTLNINSSEEGNRISGNNGCNEYGGSITIDDNGKVSIGQLLSTKMYCAQTAQLENKYMSQLGKVNQYKMDNDLLVLMDAKGNIIIKSKKLDE